MTTATKQQRAGTRDSADTELRRRRAEDELTLLKAKRAAGELTVTETPDLESILSASGELAVPFLNADNFEWGERLGDGGFAEVDAATYVGADAKIPKEVAIKSLKETRRADTDASLALAAAVREEAGHLAAIDHPAFPQVYGTFSTKNSRRGTVQQHMVVERVDGDDLAETIGKYTPAEVCSLGDQLFDAVSYLHAQGVVHRDLKPENLKIEDDCTLRVLDLGCSTKRREATFVRTKAAGTLKYLAPDTGGGEAHGRVDVYSAGIVLYEMFMGETIDKFSPMQTYNSLDFDRLRERVRREANEPFADAVVDLVRDMTLAHADLRVQKVADARMRLQDAAGLLQGEEVQEQPAQTEPSGTTFTEAVAALKQMHATVMDFIDEEERTLREYFDAQRDQELLEAAVDVCDVDSDQGCDGPVPKTNMPPFEFLERFTWFDNESSEACATDAVAEIPNRKQIYEAYQRIKQLEQEHDSERDMIMHMRQKRLSPDVIASQAGRAATAAKDLRRAREWFNSLISPYPKLGAMYAELQSMSAPTDVEMKKVNRFLNKAGLAVGLGGSTAILTNVGLGSSDIETVYFAGGLAAATLVGSVISGYKAVSEFRSIAKEKKSAKNLEARLADATRAFEFNMQYEIPEAARLGANFDFETAKGFFSTVVGRSPQKQERRVDVGYRTYIEDQQGRLAIIVEKKDGKKVGAPQIRLEVNSEGICSTEESLLGRRFDGPTHEKVIANRRDLTNLTRENDLLDSFSRDEPELYQALYEVLPEPEYTRNISKASEVLLTAKELEATKDSVEDRLHLTNRKLRDVLDRSKWSRPFRKDTTYTARELQDTLDAAGVYVDISALVRPMFETSATSHFSGLLGLKKSCGYAIELADGDGEQVFTIKNAKDKKVLIGRGGE